MGSEPQYTSLEDKVKAADSERIADEANLAAKAHQGNVPPDWGDGKAANEDRPS